MNKTLFNFDNMPKIKFYWVIKNKKTEKYCGNYSKSLRSYASRDDAKMAKKFKTREKAINFLKRVSPNSIYYGYEFIKIEVDDVKK